MKIAYIQSTSKGVNYHRLTKPLSLFEDVTAYNTIPLDKVDEVDCEVLIFNRCMIEPEQLDIIQKFKSKGVKIIVDIDDYWILPDHHVSYKAHKEIGQAKRVIQALTFADEVWTTHTKLAEKITKYNKRLRIYPNAIDSSEAQWQPMKTESDKLRIGFVGSVTHERDLYLTADAFRVAHDTLNIEAVVCGYSEVTSVIYNRFAYIMSGRKNTNTRLIAELDEFSYGTFYDQFDIAIAPLEENTFNTLKSNLKIIEAGMKATPIIVSHTHPYVDDHPAIFKTNNWRKSFKKVSRLGKDRLKELGLSLREYVLEKYELKNHKRKL
jgi:glycosyltransferase involved in cell wall biosynthesis